jgi:hypothetical protein
MLESVLENREIVEQQKSCCFIVKLEVSRGNALLETSKKCAIGKKWGQKFI